MMRPAHHALLARARAWLESERHVRSQLERVMTPILPSPGQEASLSPRAFASLMDAFVAMGLRDKAWPMLTRRRRERLELARCQAGVGDIVWTTHTRRLGAPDMRQLNGYGFLDLLGVIETYDAAVAAAVVAELREVTPAQVRLYHVARKACDIADDVSATLLQRFGGANSTNDLDRRGFDLLMRYLELFGYGRAAGPVVTTAPEARRIGFATPAQLDLIRALWAEWSGDGDEAALGTWLERFHHVSALRFLTAPAAAKVITALKAMKARRRQAETVA